MPMTLEDRDIQVASFPNTLHVLLQGIASGIQIVDDLAGVGQGGDDFVQLNVARIDAIAAMGGAKDIAVSQSPHNYTIHHQILVDCNHVASYSLSMS